MERRSRPTLRDVAVAADVSIATASRALSDTTYVDPDKRSRILAAVAALGYDTARSKTARSAMVGVIMAAYEGGDRVPHPLFQEVIEGMRRRSELAGYDLLMLTVHERERATPELTSSYVDRVRHRNLDGCILMGINGRAPQTRALVRSAIPCVGIDLDLDVGWRTAYVSSDNVGGARLAVRHLHDSGRRRIATIAGRMDSRPGVDRLLGYQLELDALGLRNRDDLVREGDFFETTGYERALELLALAERPDAIFCASDLMALGAIRAISEVGLVPGKDVALVGFDDVLVASVVTPALTTIRQDTLGLGEAAVKSLLQLIDDGEHAAAPITLPVELIVRQSTPRRERR